MTWGGDGPEAMLDGLYKVVSESEFRPEAARVVLAFTDIEFKNPMTAPGLVGKNIEDTVALLNEKGVVFTAITPRLSAVGTDRMVALCKAENAEHIVTPSLSSFAADESKIRELAVGVGGHVATEMVEPYMTASTRGRGTLTFRWRNETTADTNNVYRFICIDELSPTNLVCEMGDGWKTETLELKEGWHIFKWTYAKFGYDGAVSDCGVLADVVWEPYQTKLELDPEYAEYTHAGTTGVVATASGDAVTGGVVRVRSNSIWKATTEDDWITVHPGRDSGYGDWDGAGEAFYYTVATNTNYVARTGWITVTAGASA